MRTFLIMLFALALTGCVSTKSNEIFITEKITSPKVIAFTGDRAPWVYEIEKRLRSRGFLIKRIPSQRNIINDIDPDKTEVYSETSARFLLLVDGYAPNSSMTRCFGGGYKFDYINVELVDVKNNETVLHYSNSGYSENCPPMSGTIFTDIENAVNNAWGSL